MPPRFNVQFGQSLCDMLQAELALVCNFMDHEGRILASGDPARIGRIHPVAARIMRGEMDECSVSREEAASSGVVREGVLTAIDLDGQRLTCFTIAGPLPVVRPLAHVVRFCVTSLLQIVGGEASSLHAPLAPVANFNELLQHASTAVRFSVARLHQTLEHITEGVTLFDEQLRLVVWNRRFLEVMDWLQEPEPRGQTLEAMITRYLVLQGMQDVPQLAEHVHERMLRLRAGRSNDFQFRTLQGKCIAIADRALPGGGVVSTYTDVTERQQLLDALRNARDDAELLVQERTRTLDTLVQLSTDWFWEQDAEHRFTRTFGNVLDKLHVPPEYFVGKRRWDSPMLGVSDAQRAEHIALHERREPFRQFEYGLAMRNGEVRYLSVSGAPRFDVHGVFLGYHGTGNDITERMHNQRLLQEHSHALQQANAEMERQVAERTAQLRQQLSFMHQLLDAIPTPIFYKDTAERYLGGNRAFEQVLGKPVQDFVGKTLRQVRPDFLIRHTEEADRQLLREIGQTSFEEPVEYGDGSVHEMQLHKASFIDLSGRIGGVVGVMFDITARKRMEEDLRQAAAFFDNSIEGIMVTGLDGRVLNVNPMFTRITGYTRAQAIGQHVRIFKSGRHADSYFEAVREAVARDGNWQGEVWNKRKNGEIYPQWLSVSEVRDAQGAVVHHVASFSDMSQQKDAEERLEQLAYTDLLTRLPNRRRLLDRLGHALALGERNPQHGALLIIDIDEFKSLNDTRGHEAGDRLLQQAAHRLTSLISEGDTLARLGGDEFAVLMEGLGTDASVAVAQVQTQAERLLQALDAPYALSTGEHHHSASIGIAVFDQGHCDRAQLLQQAEMAMYRAKASGRNTLSFFDPEMQAALGRRIALEQALRSALQARQFELHYQPQVNDAGAVIGAEALVRWRTSDGTMVPPGEFIGLAERTGLILPLGRWVLDTACHQLVAWALDPARAHLSIAVNVSARQFHHPDFVEQVLQALSDSGALAQRLKLELTESLLIEDIESVITKMQTLKEHGVGFSLDDFGTGYSSLSYLKRLPLDQLKIDQSFVRDVLLDANDAAIARTVVALADSLGLQVIAEGVETAEQRDFLRASGCHAYQGYFFSRPVSIDAFEAWMTARSTR